MVNYRGNPEIVSAGKKTRFASGDGPTPARQSADKRWAEWRMECIMGARPFDANDPVSRAWVIAKLAPSSRKERAAIEKLLDEG